MRRAMHSATQHARCNATLKSRPAIHAVQSMHKIGLASRSAENGQLTSQSCHAARRMQQHV
eukprot:1909330-Alexandrium_andersonii.AAC.1